MNDDPFELGGKSRPIQVISFSKLVFGVAFGVILAQLIVVAVVVGVAISIGALERYQFNKQQNERATENERREFENWRAEKAEMERQLEEAKSKQ